MIPTRAPFQRLLAALTPALLLWTFAACMSICSGHVEEARADGAEAATTAAACASHCAESCPMTATAAPVPVKRFTPDHPPAEGAQPEQALTPYNPLNVASLPKPRPGPLSRPDPPFERLRTLRI